MGTIVQTGGICEYVWLYIFYIKYIQVQKQTKYSNKIVRKNK